MNQDTNQQQPQVPVEPQVPAQPVQAPVPNESGQQQATPPVQQEPSVSTKKNFKSMFGDLSDKFKKAPKNIKLLVIVVTLFVLSIILLLIAALVTGGKKAAKTEAPVATPTAAPGSPLLEVEISNPSRYATDSGILKIESDVDNLSKEMDSVDLRQSNLRVPNLDFNVKFQ